MGEVRMTEERGRGGPERKHEPHKLGPECPAPSKPGPSNHRQPCVAGLKSWSVSSSSVRHVYLGRGPCYRGSYRERPFSAFDDVQGDPRDDQPYAGARARLLRPGVGHPGGTLHGGPRGLLPGHEIPIYRCGPPFSSGDLGFHRPARGRGLEALALDVLADCGGLPFRRASPTGKRVDACGGAPRGWTELVRALSGFPWDGAVRHSPFDAGRLPSRWHMGSILKRPRPPSPRSPRGSSPYYLPHPPKLGEEVLCELLRFSASSMNHLLSL